MEPVNVASTTYALLTPFSLSVLVMTAVILTFYARRRANRRRVLKRGLRRAPNVAPIRDDRRDSYRPRHDAAGSDFAPSLGAAVIDDAPSFLRPGTERASEVRCDEDDRHRREAFGGSAFVTGGGFGGAAYASSPASVPDPCDSNSSFESSAPDTSSVGCSAD